eukprot:CAMPEP_0180782980 /NCGR_PEP_ID=MMETSP1038_2-20121128/48695_1 /TAXON_ID=632150 /ORGANISM="Azadinium spinosum, Strain 3D9" /LENGTH=45 /DNA_ID= /DNA_START= /DNA_END= /DNA_ORIENTATION=
MENIRMKEVSGLRAVPGFCAEYAFASSSNMRSILGASPGSFKRKR